MRVNHDLVVYKLLPETILFRMVLPWFCNEKLYCFALNDYPLLQLLLWHKLLDIIFPIISFALALIVVISLCTKSELSLCSLA
jgi:hypothetical protein